MMKPHAITCVSCLTEPAAPGDLYCDACRYQLDRGGFDAHGQMSWPAPSALATDAAGAPIAMHADQLDLAHALDQEPTR